MASGANLAESAGFKAEGLAVADDITVERTLVRLADERGAAVIVVGTHGHHALREVFLGSTAHGVIRHANCPVVVRRGPER